MLHGSGPLFNRYRFRQIAWLVHVVLEGFDGEFGCWFFGHVELTWLLIQCVGILQ